MMITHYQRPSRRAGGVSPLILNPHSMFAHPDDTRHGWSLIEMLVTITLVASLSGIAATTMTSLIRSERKGFDHVSRLSTTARLARQFRSDVHAAKSITIDSQPDTLLLQLTTTAGHEIQYQTQTAGLMRTDKVPAGAAAHELLKLAGTRFRCVEASIPRRLTLIIETPHPNSTGPQSLQTGRELHIEAIIGRDNLE